VCSVHAAVTYFKTPIKFTLILSYSKEAEQNFERKRQSLMKNVQVGNIPLQELDVIHLLYINASRKQTEHNKRS
jgi:hypothetical protein